MIDLKLRKGGKSLQKFPAIGIFKNPHLLNGNLIEFDKAIRLRHTIIDEYGIEILHIRKTNQFIDAGIVTDIAFLSGLASRHSFAVIPNIAIFSTSASSAYFMAACSRVTSAGMRFSFMASV